MRRDWWKKSLISGKLKNVILAESRVERKTWENIFSSHSNVWYDITNFLSQVSLFSHYPTRQISINRPSYVTRLAIFYFKPYLRLHFLQSLEQIR